MDAAHTRESLELHAPIPRRQGGPASKRAYKTTHQALYSVYLDYRATTKDSLYRHIPIRDDSSPDTGVRCYCNEENTTLRIQVQLTVALDRLYESSMQELKEVRHHLEEAEEENMTLRCCLCEFTPTPVSPPSKRARSKPLSSSGS